MKYCSLWEGGPIVSTIALGTYPMGGWQWGNCVDVSQAKATIYRAMDIGINFFDTAPIYGFGLIEKLIGKIIRETNSHIVIATKCGLRWDCSEGSYFFNTTDLDGGCKQIYRNLRPASIRKEVETSLTRLGVESIDLLQCHWPDPSTPLSETLDCLRNLVREGKIRRFGLSNYSGGDIHAATMAGAVTHQFRYSLLEQNTEGSVIPDSRKAGLGLLPYGVLAGGFLTRSTISERNFDIDDHRSRRPWFFPINRAKAGAFLKAYTEIALSLNLSNLGLAVSWAISENGVSSVLVGARQPSHVDQIARLPVIQLHDSVRTQLGELAKEFIGSLSIRSKDIT